MKLLERLKLKLQKLLKLAGKMLLVVFALLGAVVVLVAIFAPETTQTTSDTKQSEAKDAGVRVKDTKPISPADAEICRGKDAEIPAVYDKTLHSAARKNACETAARMIANGANVNAHDGDRTPLHYAGNALETAELLISHGANVNARGDHDWTPLYFVKTLETAKLLVAHGADVNGRAARDHTPLHEAIRFEAPIEIAEFLISQGADIQARGWNNWTPLHYAVDAGNVEIAEWLIANNADVNAVGGYGTPLEFAIFLEKEKMIALLRAHGGKCNVKCP